MAWRPKKKHALAALGYDLTSWTRVVMNRECLAAAKALGPGDMDVLEISGGESFYKKELAPYCRTYRQADYPDYDVCESALPEKFDLIVADQVWPHILWPYRASKNVLSMLKPGGTFICTVSFLIKVNYSPIDCTRWTELGLKCLLIEAGFPEAGIATGAWGNRWAVITNLFRLGKRRGWFRPLFNEKDFPVSVWAIARKA